MEKIKTTRDMAFDSFIKPEDSLKNAPWKGERIVRLKELRDAAIDRIIQIMQAYAITENELPKMITWVDSQKGYQMLCFKMDTKNNPEIDKSDGISMVAILIEMFDISEDEIKQNKS
jgi:hypothetical protein